MEGGGTASSARRPGACQDRQNRYHRGARPGVLDIVTGADIVATGWKSPPVMSFFKGVGGVRCASVPRRAGARPGAFRRRAGGAGRRRDRALAQDAAELIAIEYEDLPVIVEAADGDRVRRRRRSRRRCRAISRFDYEYGDRASTEQGFANAAHVVRVELRAQRISGNPMEPKSCIARYDAGEGAVRALRADPGHPRHLKTALAQITGLPPRNFASARPMSAARFGVRNEIYPEFLAVMLAAKRDRPAGEMDRHALGDDVRRSSRAAPPI